MSERARDGSVASIYERSSDAAKRFAPVHRSVARIASGATLGTALWLMLSTLGVADVFHLERMAGLGPFAIAGAAIWFTRARLALAVITLAAAILLLLIAYTGVAVAPARALIRADPLPRGADAVVVLSAGVTRDGLVRPQGADRLIKGLELVRSGVAPQLVLTREERSSGNRRLSSAGDQDRIVGLAATVRWTATPLVRSTRGEALAVAPLAREGKWRRTVVVTSPFHTRRACGVFEKVGLVVSCIPSDWRDISIHSAESPDDRLGLFRAWLYETAGTIRYRQLGWL